LPCRDLFFCFTTDWIRISNRRIETKKPEKKENMRRPRPSTQHKKEKVKGPRISNLATTGNYQQHNKKKPCVEK
jgi:hypothetical protein